MGHTEISISNLLLEASLEETLASLTSPERQEAEEVKGDNMSVVSECQNKKGCRIKVSPEVVGQDPCPGLGKYLEVAYKCHPTEFRTKVVCQGEKLALDCGPGERIVFLSAFFGRDPKDAPRCPQPRGVHEEACEASYANEFVLGVCKRKRKCILEADSSIFKAPCRPNSKGYLKVASTCVPRDVLLQEFQGDLLEDEMEEESTETWLDEDDKHSRQSLSLSTLGKRPEKGERGSGWSSDVPVPAQEVDLSSVDVGTGTPTTKDPSNDTLSRDPYVALVVDWITAYQFIQANKETFILYLVLSISGGVLLFCSALVLRIMASRGRRKERNEADSEKPLGPGVNGGLLPFPGDSDTENEGGSGDLTFVGDLTSFGVLSPPDDVTLDVVRYTSRGTLRRQDSDTHPRSFSRHLDEHHLYS
ncbi:unnamed protein product [Darwinula stevensoni]|uniref:SUEL-type lectin domain-containing protein n=1 Tax=Darwinula stevensoni TaxID=69355 RepID=A0A7R9A2C5_9CRUS|nr:unnamed protein product [Darwinula stevensoni]CAG0879208.1 unnamed protein product [Darwinula stevensoni]